VNERPHPGEKRLVQHALASCPNAPPGMPQQIVALIGAMGDGRLLIDRVHTLLDGFDQSLRVQLGLP